MVVNQQTLHALAVGYNTAYNKGFDSIEKTYDKIATTVPSSTSEQTYPWLGQMPGMKEWIGEREIQKLAAHGYSIRNRKFEMTIAVPRDMIDDDTHGVFTPMFTQMGESAALHPQELVYECLKAGFVQKCYDEKPFFSAEHEVNGVKYSNLSDQKLSAESYRAARTAMMGLVGDAGKPLGLVPDLLVVPPALEYEANLILKADQINGTSNVLKDTAQLLVAPELADMPDAWFLLCTKRFLKPLVYQERKKIKFTSFTKDTDPNVFLKDEYVYGADGRDNAGYGFWQMAQGSTGKAEG